MNGLQRNRYFFVNTIAKLKGAAVHELVYLENHYKSEVFKDPRSRAWLKAIIERWHTNIYHFHSLTKYDFRELPYVDTTI